MKNNLPISLWLTEDEQMLMHCIICGNSLGIKIEGSPQMMLIGIDSGDTTDENYKPLKFPIRLNCKTKSQKYGDCRARYIIQGFIYPHKDEE